MVDRGEIENGGGAGDAVGAVGVGPGGSGRACGLEACSARFIIGQSVVDDTAGHREGRLGGGLQRRAAEREPGPEACWGSAEERKLAGHRMVKRSRFCGLRMEQCTISSSSGCHGCHNKAVVRTVRGGPLSTRAVRRASTLFHTKPAAGGCEGLPVTPFQAAIQWGCTIQCGHCFEQILPTNGTKAAHESGPHWEG
ncbi:hypothetical protein CYMTET_56335 [Cymbomonas tetramitiformis]|uniref:Uncharacterized protein n=1 Tax=Cymbomonas tetramitiformis TaxID=36881 RepID=A0AAE0EM22_9CHLO|nr:hypothetical protein CYMTET_56335 [Cymbomonas tetramitiformis]